METYKRDAKSTKLKPYCYFAKEDDFVEYVEWHNGEGVDIFINNSTSEKHISLTYGEFDAILALHFKRSDSENNR